MAETLTRKCSCQEEHLCPRATSLRQKVADLLAVVETADDEDAQRECSIECRQALRAYRRHVGRRW